MIVALAKMKTMAVMLYLSKSRHIAKPRHFGCFNSVLGSYDTLIYLNYMEDVWILGDYLNSMLLKYDKENKKIEWCYIYIYIVKYNNKY